MLGGARGSWEDGFCYNVRVAGAGGVRNVEIKPITRFPAGHALTRGEAVCGVSYAVGDLIPSNGSWKGSGCAPADGAGEIFYAYGWPNTSSGTWHETRTIFDMKQEHELGHLWRGHRRGPHQTTHP